MPRLEILDELKKLSLSDRLTIIESAVRHIRDDLQRDGQAPEPDTRKQQLAIGAEALLADYSSDRELTAFTVLDGEDFYDKG